MSLEEYLQLNIHSNTLKIVEKFMESSHYKEMQKFLESDTFRNAQESLKKRDSLIHEDTLEQIKKMQEQIESSSFFVISEAQKAEFDTMQKNMHIMLKNFTINHD